jgi:hypothetical protein
MAIGHSLGAYAQLSSLPDYEGEAFDKARDLKYKYDVLNKDNQEQKDRAKAEQKNANDKLLAEKEKRANEVKMPDVATVTTLNDNLEQTKYKYVNKLRDATIEIKNEIRGTDDPNKLAELQAKQSKLSQNLSSFNDFSSKINDRIKYLADNKDKTDPDSYMEEMATLTMANKGYSEIDIDDKGNVIYSLIDPTSGLPIEEQKGKSFANFIVDAQTKSLSKSTFDEDLKTSVDAVGVKTTVDEKGISHTETVKPTKENLDISKKQFISEFLNKPNNRTRFAKDNKIDPTDTKTLSEKVGEIYESKISSKRVNTINTSEANRLDSKNKDEQSFTTTPDIPLNLKNAGVKQGENLVMTIENGKAKPSLSFTNKNGGKVLNFTNVIPQKVSRVLKDGKYVYVTEISHLKPTRVYAEIGDDLGDGTKATKKTYLGTTDVQTSEVVILREANALNLLKSKTIKTKEDLRSVFPKENVQPKTESKNNNTNDPLNLFGN